ncbi:sugar-binding transcriptional regulator [Paenibacillus algorifonticola]|uniref:RNA polymerase subunit sigma-70 n=1 Tax=Paenibacillus sp. BIHB 4019 TaxID=1870819 RepID=A0A1B2DEG1_9BACL|nr:MULTISPECIES: sugar-binding transcriptional regulator [unclassified Paenibacillus]ANY66101.1 RNA polymerase subunit sigma-70 [Paenibacillus sp. BIHB 4019]KQO18509.1 RNA polymerase subunit sigma-70 [Paenibacillus sp. Leaf72]
MEELSDKKMKMIEAARMYYELDYNQQEIAKKLGVSRPTVSRFLQQAKVDGIVQIKIMDPAADNADRERQLQERFGLKRAIVATVPKYEDAMAKRVIGEAAAAFLNETVQDGDTIAVTWGTTLYEVATRLPNKHAKKVKVVQLNGGVSHSETDTYAHEIAQLFAKAYQTSPYLIPLPAIVDHAVVKHAIEADRHIRKILDMGKKANIAVVTVGAPTEDSVLMRANYFSDEDLGIIFSRGVGDICSRFIDINGQLVSEELDLRTIGIDLGELKRKEWSVLVAGGPSKVEAVYGALAGQYANTLITDHITAKHLLDYKPEA